MNVDFPAWVVHLLHREAQRLGVTRQPLITMWVAERLEATAERWNDLVSRYGGLIEIIGLLTRRRAREGLDTSP